MNFIKNNREVVVLILVIVGVFVMASTIGYNFRGGNAWVF